MPKRNAGTELNDQNWDQEEEAEEAGTFKLADEEELKKRPTLKARRTINTDGSRPGGSVFAGFSLMKSAGSAPSSGFSLSFGTGASSQAKSNGAADTTKTNGTGNESASKENPEYLRQLKTLNNNILSWIKKHVEENPYCILTPSFRDYEKHLHDLEKKYGVHPTLATETESKSKETEKSAGSLFSAASTADGESTADTVDNTSMMEGPSEKPEKTETKAPVFGGFSFGQSSNGSLGTSTTFGGTTFGSGSSFGTGGSMFGGLTQKPFSFGSQASMTSTGASASQSQSQGAGEGADDEDYVPPKPEVREIKEEGSFYTKRCKLFYQKDSQWVDRGVGNLHLKPTDVGKTQLIVRADTNLGNILLNILLSSAMPTKKQGKNNVFIVCAPNPPINPKEKEQSSNPVPMLIRVKTSEDADELLAKLEECKSSG